MKKGNMELGKKIITWAMAAVMTVTSVGGSFGTMTVYATDAPTAEEIVAEIQEETHKKVVEEVSSRLCGMSVGGYGYGLKGMIEQTVMEMMR